LLLIYGFIVGFISLFSIYPIVKLYKEVIDKDYDKLVVLILATIGFLLMIVYLVTMYIFLSYHFMLIDSNETTIDKMNQKRG